MKTIFIKKNRITGFKNSIRPLIAGIIIILLAAFNGISISEESGVTIYVSGMVTDINSNPLEGVNVSIKGTSTGTLTDAAGKYQITVKSGNKLVFSMVGYKTHEVKIINQPVVDVILEEESEKLNEVVFVPAHRSFFCKVKSTATADAAMASGTDYNYQEINDYASENYNTEGYAGINENNFKKVTESPVSTFSIDVDAASYTNIRRFINYGQKPPADAVRIEEMINFFKYDYPQPDGNHPFAASYEFSECPWNKNHRLLLIGLQGKTISTENLPPSNLVFLIDVSGSMSDENKLPLVIEAFKLLVNQLRDEDKVAIVVYAGASGLVLPPTKGSDKKAILDALNKLEAGGSTAGGEGLKLAYKVAGQNFIQDGNNRIILATDGDFNVGLSSNADMENLIEQEREKGIYISVLGFGMGNYKDDKMEIIADKGNGNYAYIDNLKEAERIFVKEFGGTLFTIAKDVKLQIEFNPAMVESYRLIGYENRILNREDFNDDKKDAGELGSGHSVTALYEIILHNQKQNEVNQGLKYQTGNLTNAALGNELATLKMRYKNPDSDISKLMEVIIENRFVDIQKTSENFRFAASVAEFGMLLRNSEHKGTATYEEVISLASDAKGKDADGYRNEFINMVNKTIGW